MVLIYDKCLNLKINAIPNFLASKITETAEDDSDNGSENANFCFRISRSTDISVKYPYLIEQRIIDNSPDGVNDFTGTLKLEFHNSLTDERILIACLSKPIKGSLDLSGTEWVDECSGALIYVNTSSCFIVDYPEEYSKVKTKYPGVIYEDIHEIIAQNSDNWSDAFELIFPPLSNLSLNLEVTDIPTEDQITSTILNKKQSFLDIIRSEFDEKLESYKKNLLEKLNSEEKKTEDQARILIEAASKSFNRNKSRPESLLNIESAAHGSGLIRPKKTQTESDGGEIFQIDGLSDSISEMGIDSHEKYLEEPIEFEQVGRAERLKDSFSTDRNDETKDEFFGKSVPIAIPMTCPTRRIASSSSSTKPPNIHDDDDKQFIAPHILSQQTYSDIDSESLFGQLPRKSRITRTYY